jgi:hypothetical protein
MVATQVKDMGEIEMTGLVTKGVHWQVVNACLKRGKGIWVETDSHVESS